MSYIIREAKANTYFRSSFWKNKSWQHNFVAVLDYAKKFPTYGAAIAKRNQVQRDKPHMVLVIDQV